MAVTFCWIILFMSIKKKKKKLVSSLKNNLGETVFKTEEKTFFPKQN